MVRLSAVVALLCSLTADLHGRPPPAHRDAFAAAWTAIRACLVGAPAWSADLDKARQIQ
jgi:hypothetical protein